jgi:hypothetical protein
MASAAEKTPKQRATELINELPDGASWDEVVYKLAVGRSIERGIRDADAGRLTEVNDIRKQYGLSE